ncbi:MAG: 7-cyano-7-deazaguanine synthase [bacterium]
MMKNKAVVLMSGGMDSAVCTSIAKESGYELAALHLNYGQRTQKREKKAFDDLTKYFGINEILEVNVSYFSQIGASSLTDTNIDIPITNFELRITNELKTQNSKLPTEKSENGQLITDNELTTPNSQLETEIPSSYVPFRNGNILAIAASWAEAIGAIAIFIGAMQLDFSGYPDCRREFFDAFEKAINLGTKPETNIEIVTPIINLTKKDVVIKGIELGVPFELTWSCYKDEDLACGVCDSCVLRLRGFEQAGFKDPIEYK